MNLGLQMVYILCYRIPIPKFVKYSKQWSCYHDSTVEKGIARFYFMTFLTFHYNVYMYVTFVTPNTLCDK